MSRVLGVDCGSSATGYGIIDSDGRFSSMVAAGIIRPGRRAAFASRLEHIARSLRGLICTHQPQAMAVEGVFHSVNARSALQLGHVRGVALLSAAEANLPVHEYSALQIKSSVVGYGRAEKSQVQQMVALLLRLDRLPGEDAADALAVALCHAHHCFTLGRMAPAVAAPPRAPSALV